MENDSFGNIFIKVVSSACNTLLKQIAKQSFLNNNFDDIPQIKIENSFKARRYLTFFFSFSFFLSLFLKYQFLSLHKIQEEIDLIRNTSSSEIDLVLLRSYGGRNVFISLDSNICFSIFLLIFSSKIQLFYKSRGSIWFLLG